MMREAPWFQVESDEAAVPVYVLPWQALHLNPDLHLKS